jgi:protein TonB
MSDAEFQVEVSRQVALELKRLEEQLRRSSQKAVAPPTATLSAEPSSKVAVPDLEPTAAEPAPEEPPAEVKADPVPPPDAPEPARSSISESPMARAETREEPLVSVADPGTPPRIKKMVRPIYPPLALRHRIGGIVILRVLVSEAGRPLEVEVLRGVRAGISEAAAAAVRRWTFEPSIKNGVPVEAWTTIPIPFKP